jgi:hypothetical protein
MKRIIYTCVTNGYDTIAEQSCIPEGWELQVFTGQDPALPPQRQARRMKLCPHWYFEYDECIWFDGNLRIIDPGLFTLTDNLVLMRHPLRTSVYHEAEVCKRYGKAPISTIDAQMRFYHTQSLPAELGLPATGIIFRRNTEAIRTFCEAWWAELAKFTARDQLSFNYAAWTTGTSFRLLDMDTTVVKCTYHRRKDYLAAELRYQQQRSAELQQLKKELALSSVRTPQDRRNRLLHNQYLGRCVRPNLQHTVTPLRIQNSVRKVK